MRSRRPPSPGRVSAVAVPLSWILALHGGAATAQWNPGIGQWGRSSSSDLRIMTWNVLDAVCSTNAKNVASNNWAAVARVVAAMQPDVLILQECGDNNGNGTGSNDDSQSALSAAVGMFVHGGADTFHSGSPAITQYVQAFAPGYDLPFVFVSSVNDGYNRNVILSRYPFLDLNGDSVSTRSDIPNISADLYAPGGNGGIRGYMTAEIDLPDAVYAGDLVVGNSHLKAGGGSSNHNQRVTAAKNIAYYLDYFWNGAGGTVPDPRHRIADNPPATSVLGPNTPFITGGDLNEDEYTNGTVGPVDWIARAQVANSGTDGTDRNRTDMTYDQALDQFNGSAATFRNSPYKDDYLIWQDSICALRRTFLFDTTTALPAAMPPQLAGFPGGSAHVNATASDHLPVIGDFILPAPLGCNDAGTDLGFASLGGNGTFPRFSACGGLASGQTATFTIGSAAPGAPAWLGLSPQRGLLVLFDATILVDQPQILGPWFTDATGSFGLGVNGGGGPVGLYLQWVVFDAAAAYGLSFSNALRVDFP